MTRWRSSAPPLERGSRAERGVDDAADRTARRRRRGQCGDRDHRSAAVVGWRGRWSGSPGWQRGGPMPSPRNSAGGGRCGAPASSRGRRRSRVCMVVSRASGVAVGPGLRFAVRDDVGWLRAVDGVVLEAVGLPSHASSRCSAGWTPADTSRTVPRGNRSAGAQPGRSTSCGAPAVRASSCPTSPWKPPSPTL